MKQRFILIIGLMFAAILTACDSMGGGEILVEMEVTTVVTELVVVTATPEGDSVAQAAPLTVNTVSPEDADATQDAITETPASSETPGPTPTPDIYPTPIVGEILIAEQDFQNGKMFWLQPIDQIWIATTNSDGEQVWINRADEFEDGMTELNPQLTPPAQGLLQPIRGFGMLWRDEPGLQSTLGWATGDEFGHTTNYEYHWGGTVNDENEYEAGPGYHLLTTLNRSVYRFDEATRTWEILRQEE